MPPTPGSNIRSRGHCCSQSSQSPSSCSPITENIPDESAGFRPPRRRFGPDKIKEPFPSEESSTTLFPGNPSADTGESSKDSLGTRRKAPSSGSSGRSSLRHRSPSSRSSPGLPPPQNGRDFVFRGNVLPSIRHPVRPKTRPSRSDEPDNLFISEQNPSPKSHRYP